MKLPGFLVDQDLFEEPPQKGLGGLRASSDHRFSDLFAQRTDLSVSPFAFCVLRRPGHSRLGRRTRSPREFDWPCSESPVRVALSAGRPSDTPCSAFLTGADLAQAQPRPLRHPPSGTEA